MVKKFILLLLLSLPLMSYSQEKGAGETNHKKRLKELDKKKNEQKEAEEKALKEMHEHQLKIQSKETRKRMKRSKKIADRNNSGKKGGISGWFKPKK